MARDGRLPAFLEPEPSTLLAALAEETRALSELGSSNPEGTAGSVNRDSQSAHLNVIWSPVAQTNFGLEYIHARREVQNGESGTLNRLQAAAQYFF